MHNTFTCRQCWLDDVLYGESFLYKQPGGDFKHLDPSLVEIVRFTNARSSFSKPRFLLDDYDVQYSFLHGFWNEEPAQVSWHRRLRFRCQDLRMWLAKRVAGSGWPDASF